MAEADSVVAIEAAAEAPVAVVNAVAEETVAVVVAANAAAVTEEEVADVVDLIRPACCNGWTATETARWIPTNKRAPPDS